jgi:hypothetical protein
VPGAQPALALLAGLAWAMAAGCAHLSRPEGPPGPSLRDAELLDPAPAPRLLIELDRVEGSRPRPRALRTFLLRLDRYLDKPGGIELRVDAPLPRSEWQEDGPAIRRLAVRNRSHFARAGQSSLHVLYGPSYGKYRGYTWLRATMSRYSTRYRAPLVLVLQDRLKPILWLTGVKQEASVLVHELGHAVGLVTNPGHGSGGHCTNAWCLMYDGVDARTFLLYLFPTLFTGYLPLDWCGDCRRDLYPAIDGAPPGRRKQ